MSHNRKNIGRQFRAPVKKQKSDFYISLGFFLVACAAGLAIGFLIQAVAR